MSLDGVNFQLLVELKTVLIFSSMYMNYFCYKATDMCTIVILLKYVAVVNIRAFNLVLYLYLAIT